MAAHRHSQDLLATMAVAPYHLSLPASPAAAAAALEKVSIHSDQSPYTTSTSGGEASPAPASDSRSTASIFMYSIGYHLDVAACTPVLLARRGAAKGSDAPLPAARAVRLLRIHAVYTSASALRLAGNLVESIVAALPHYPAADTAELAFDGVCIGLHSTSPAPTEDGSAPETTITTKTAHQSSLTSSTHMAAFGSPAYYAALKAKHAVFTDIIDQSQKTRQQQHRTAAADEDPAVAEIEVIWTTPEHVPGSSSSHSERVLMETRAKGTVSLLPWALFLDADTQVYKGWAAYVSSLLHNTSVMAHCGANYGPRCDARGGIGQGEGAEGANVSIFFQRESRKHINTGVVLLRLTCPAVQCLYRQALTLFKPEAYGDQTALQRVLKDIRKHHGRCSMQSTTTTNSRNNNSQTRTGGAAAGDDDDTRARKKRQVMMKTDEALEQLVQAPRDGTMPRLHQYVFHRLRVNAAILDPGQLVIQHAHMSGMFKAKHLLQSAVWMNASISGAFLWQLAERSKHKNRDILPLAGGTSSAAARHLQDTGRRATIYAAEDAKDICPPSALVMKQQQQQYPDSGAAAAGDHGGNTVRNSIPLVTPCHIAQQLVLAAQCGRSSQCVHVSQQHRKRSYAAQEGADGPSRAPPPPSVLSGGTSAAPSPPPYGVGVNVGGRMVRANEEAVGFWWTVVPALIVLATLFFYHYMVAR